MAHLCRSTGHQESEQLLSTIVGQYRRLVSTSAVRAQALCSVHSGKGWSHLSQSDLLVLLL